MALTIVHCLTDSSLWSVCLHPLLIQPIILSLSVSLTTPNHLSLLTSAFTLFFHFCRSLSLYHCIGLFLFSTWFQLLLNIFLPLVSPSYLILPIPFPSCLSSVFLLDVYVCQITNSQLHLLVLLSFLIISMHLHMQTGTNTHTYINTLKH